jgi:hypothetical protein
MVMSGSTQAFKAIFERLVEITEKKAQAKGKTIYKTKKEPKCKPTKQKLKFSLH